MMSLRRTARQNQGPHRATWSDARADRRRPPARV